MEAKTKNILIGLTVVAVGTGSYLLYRSLKLKSNESSDIDNVVNSYSPPSSYSPPKTPKGTGTSSSLFPLKNKSKGVLVSDLQKALIKKYGKDILPKYGADGYFGKELETALVRKGYSVPVTKETFDKIVKNQSSSSTDREKAKDIAQLLHEGISKQSIEKALQGLYKIKNVLSYAKVNEAFKQTRIDGIRMTIPTALADTFPKEAERKKYRAQLYRIGLKYRNDKWALAGLVSRARAMLMTNKRTKIYEASGQFHWVPINTLLGQFRSSKNGLHEFISKDGKSHFVQSSAIRFTYD